MTREELVGQIRSKKSFLCVGLDPDLDKIPTHFLSEEDPIFEFNKAVIDATRDLCVAYKPNTAFYECYGLKGWQSLEKTIAYIGDSHFVIADAKRGDIGNTSSRYAKAFFEEMNANAITVAPYMGEDSVKPFLEFTKKWTVLLALTSNKGSHDFQYLGESPLFEQVLTKAKTWGDAEQLMFVVGATHPEDFAKIRKIIPDYFLLVPGIGAQGGSLEKVAVHGMNEDVGLLVNSSRGIIYAGGKGHDFIDGVRSSAQNIQTQMSLLLKS